jgi:hypothetical protein
MTDRSTADPQDERDHGRQPFLRGLTIGVLVGAAIAGSRIWRRLLERRAAD